uniref:MIT domain-containing protein n=1 Tax=Syphacia muris TaxID=451379 RepID=A0A0N5AHQ8_9BILA
MLDLIEKSRPVLEEAVNLDTKGCREEAITKYIDGISLLLESLSSTELSTTIKKTLKQRIDEYMTRAEFLKNKAKAKVSFVERIQIEAGSTGYGYDKVFARCFDDKVTNVYVQDAYVRSRHQVTNFIAFCELCVLNAKNLKSIQLTTHKDVNNEEALLELKKSFAECGRILNVAFDDNLHDREIRFDNGWIIKIGRGLDYFKNPGRNALGTCERNLRQCQKTTIDVFMCK